MNILCFRNSRLGDLLVVIPALKLIKKKNPKAKIFYVTDYNKNSSSLPKCFEKDKIIDEYIFYNYNFIGIFKLAKNIRKTNFDCIYNLHDAENFFRRVRNCLFFYFCGLKKKYGFFYKKENYRKYNEAFQLAKRVNKGIKLKDLYKLKQLKKKREKPLIQGNYITISHGGISSPGLWPMEKWKKLILELISTYKFKIIIVGNSFEKKNGEILKRLKPGQIINSCGKTSLKNLFNLIKFSKIHISNDNGTMHVAALYDKKTICIFNDHDPYGKWFPLNKNAVIIWKNGGIKNIHPKYLIRIIKKNV